MDLTALRSAIDELPVVDHHCAPIAGAAADTPLRTAFATPASCPGEGSAAAAAAAALAPHTAQSVSFRRTVRDLAALYRCAPSEGDVVLNRRALGPERLARACFGGANCLALFLCAPPAFAASDQPLSWHQQFVRWVRHVVAFARDQADPPADTAALAVDLAAPLDTATLAAALEASIARSIPLHVTLRRGLSPAALEPVLARPEFDGATVVIVAAGYPHVREAAVLAATHASVHVDLGLCGLGLSLSAMRQAVSTLLELAPTTKILYASGAAIVPDRVYLGALWTRHVLTDVLEALATDEDLTPTECYEVAASILYGNAQRIYQLTDEQAGGPDAGAAAGAQPHQDASTEEEYTEETYDSTAPHTATATSGTVTPHEVGLAGVAAAGGLEAGAASQASTTQIRLIRLMYADVSGKRRAHVVPTETYYNEELARTGLFIETLCPAAEVSILPDLTTLKTLAWSPTHAAVVCDLVDGDKVWPFCSRGMLRRQLGALLDHGIELVCGYESDFSLISKADLAALGEPCAPAFLAETGIDAFGDFVDHLVDILQQMAIAPRMLATGAGQPGQLRVALQSAAALDAADQQLLFRETVEALAHARGLRAVFAPQPFPNAEGNGCRLQLAFWGSNQLSSADTVAHFSAGIRAHLGALLAVTAPSANSFRRLEATSARRGGFLGGAIKAAPDQGRLTFTLSDGTAAPHMALAALIAAGIDGLTRKLGTSPAKESPAPASLGDALDALQADKVLATAIGPEVHSMYVDMRRAELKAIAATGNEIVPLLG